MAVDIGPRIGIDGENEFRKQILQINQSIKTLGSEMKAVTGEFVDQENAQENLTKQNEVLGRTVTALREKLSAQEKMLKESAEAYGEADIKTLKWQQAVNETRVALNKAEAQIRSNERSIDSLGDEVQDTGEQFEKTEKKASNFGNNLKTGIGVATKAVAAFTGAALAAVGAVASLTIQAAYNADDINTLATQTGLSTEEIQKFQFASEQIDVSLDTLTGSMARLIRNMNTARTGTGAAYEAFDALGVSITDANGNLRDSHDVFGEAIDALAEMENETERDATAMALFGKSAQDLNPLILGGSEALEEYSRQAEDAGLILSQDTLDSLNEVSDAMDTFKATATGAGNALTVAFVPALAEGLNTITSYISRIVNAYDAGGFVGVKAAMNNIIKEISDSVTKNAPSIISTGADIVVNLISGIVSQAPALFDVANSILGTLLSSDVLGKILNQIPSLVDSAIGFVADFLSSGAFEELIPIIVGVVLELVNVVISNADLMVDASISLIESLVNGILAALPLLAEQAPYIVLDLVSALIRNVPKMHQAARELISGLASGIWSAYTRYASVALEIVSNFVARIRNAIGRVVAVGRDIVSGLWRGISERISWFMGKVGDFFSGVVSFVKDFLGIRSPSKVFAEIGGYMAQGIGVGFQNAMGSVAGEMTASIPVPDTTTANAIAGAVNGIGTLIGTDSRPLELVININGKTLARETLQDFINVANQRGVVLV